MKAHARYPTFAYILIKTSSRMSSAMIKVSEGSGSTYIQNPKCLIYCVRIVYNMRSKITLLSAIHAVYS